MIMFLLNIKCTENVYLLNLISVLNYDISLSIFTPSASISKVIFRNTNARTFISFLLPATDRFKAFLFFLQLTFSIQVYFFLQLTVPRKFSFCLQPTASRWLFLCPKLTVSRRYLFCWQPTVSRAFVFCLQLIVPSKFLICLRFTDPRQFIFLSATDLFKS